MFKLAFNLHKAGISREGKVVFFDETIRREKVEISDKKGVDSGVEKFRLPIFVLNVIVNTGYQVKTPRWSSI